MKTITLDKKTFDILYWDIQYNTEEAKVVIQSEPMSRNVHWDSEAKQIAIIPTRKKIELTENTITDAHIAAYLNSNVEVKEERSILITSAALNKLLLSMSFLIATEGRIGYANSVMCNSKTSKLISDLPNQLSLQINEYLNDNEFFVTTIGNVTLNKDAIHPGYYIFKHIDENKVNYENIVALGFFPNKQIARIKLS